jgi:hypothetical protein
MNTRYHLLVLGCALAAFADRLCGRGLAVNEAPAIPGTLPLETPVVTVGVPTNLAPDKVLARKKALIEAGTEPLLAEKLAIDAEQQQYLRDHHLSLSATVEERPATETVLKIKTHPDGEAEDVDLGSLTVPKLKELAEANEYDLKGATNKADIIKAITAAAKCLVVAFICALFFGTAAPSHASVASPIAVTAAVSAAPVAVIAPAIPDSSMFTVLFAYLQLDVEQWVGVICAVAIAIAAVAWLPKRYRSWGAHLRYLTAKARELIASKWRRGLFRIGIYCALVDTRLRGRLLATNVVFTPQQTSHGTVSLDGTEAIATKNYVVVRGADDRHFKAVSVVTDVPLGILLNDEIAADEVDVVKKNIALFGLWPESLPGVAEAAIAVDAWLTPGVGTLGRVKALPTTPGIYWVIGRSRFTVASAGDPVSIAHFVPFQVKVGIGYVTGDGGAVTQLTDSTTGVTLSKLTGQITTVALTTAAAAEERFTVTNTLVAATDIPVVSTTYAGAGTPAVVVTKVVAGAFDIVITNLHASAALNAAMVINFAVIRGVAA